MARSSSSSSTKAAALLLLLAATAASVHGFLTPAARPRSPFKTGPRRAAFIEVERTTGGGSGEEDESGGRGSGRGGGPGATVITERAWNASTLGALPTDLEGLSKAVRSTCLCV